MPIVLFNWVLFTRIANHISSHCCCGLFHFGCQKRLDLYINVYMYVLLVCGSSKVTCLAFKIIKVARMSFHHRTFILSNAYALSQYDIEISQTLQKHTKIESVDGVQKSFFVILIHYLFCTFVLLYYNQTEWVTFPIHRNTAVVSI